MMANDARGNAADTGTGSDSLPRLAVNGAAGRMGRQLLTVIAERHDVALGAGIELAGTPAIGTDTSLLVAESAAGIAVVDNVNHVLDDFDVLIDFTRPESSLALVERLQQHGKPMVIGTTGFTEDQKFLIHTAAEQIPVVFAPNFSAGVTLVLKLLATTAKALGDDYDIEIIEAHHRNKVDAPSGTAIRMGEAVADAIGRDLDTCAVYGREGNTGIRDAGTIGFETIRGGDIIGDHTVLFAGLGERIEIAHKATDRMIFARGAVRAAQWVADKPAGLYDMADVIGL